MDKKDIDAIYNLMQNVSDKLDNISKETALKNSVNNADKILGILERQELNIKNLAHIKNGLSEKNINAKGDITHNKTFVLFGKDSSMNNQYFFLLISILFVFWIGFKYLTPIISEQDELRLQNKNYRTMYHYIYLKDFFDKKQNTPIKQLMEKIQTKDPEFTKELNMMLTEHRKISRRIELENELKKLK